MNAYKWMLIWKPGLVKRPVSFDCFVVSISASRRSLSSDSTKTLVNAFVNSRLDYCNSLLYGVGEGLMDRLQRVQNAATRLVSGAKKYDHITPMMDLHWLPIQSIQGGHYGLQISPWLRSSLPCRWLRRCFVDSWSSISAFGGASGIDCTEDKNNDFRSACFSCVWTNGLELVAVHTEITRTFL